MYENETKLVSGGHDCANCGVMLWEKVIIIQDNFMNLKYFETEEENMFCSNDCLAESLFAEEIKLEEPDWPGGNE